MRCALDHERLDQNSMMPYGRFTVHAKAAESGDTLVAVHPLHEVYEGRLLEGDETNVHVKQKYELPPPVSIRLKK